VQIDFSRYKPRLKDLLRQYGVDVSANPTHCFNQGAHKHGDANPSLQLFDDSFKCHGCGIQGDIYDAVEILENITDKKAQYEFIEKLFAGSVSVKPIKPFNKDEWVREAANFKPDSDTCKRFEEYLRKNEAAPKMVKLFLDTRAYVSTKGDVTTYPADVEKYIIEQLFYWPGLSAVRGDFGNDNLKKCGVPLVNPNTERSLWDHSGVVMRLGAGYKLHYYEKRYCNNCPEREACEKKPPERCCQTCEKRNSKGGSTFPTPGEIDKTQPVIIVEGEMNALSCRAIGIKNIFSAGGTNGLTGPKVKQYLLDVPEVVLFFDSDSAGRKASGLEPFNENDKRKSNIPQIIQKAGYAGKIRLAELPPTAETGYKDQDGLIIAGKRDIVIKAIENAKEYEPLPVPEAKSSKCAKGTIWEAYESISIERLKDLLGKIERNMLDFDDIQPFVSACAKACKHQNTRQELLKWNATLEEIEAQNDVSPYYLLEACNKYGVSKYLKREIEKSLVPESEMLNSIKEQSLNVKIDYKKIEKSDIVRQFMATHGVHSAAQVVHEVLDGNIVYLKNENRFYSFNGHVWEYESNMSGIVYAVICSIIRHFLQNKLAEKGMLWDLRIKTEQRKFRVEIVQDFAEFHDIHQIDTSFDSPLIKETVTLSDGVLDFSGVDIVYRKSKREEFRRDYLPYSINDVKKSSINDYCKFMSSNFKNEKTLETLYYYLSLIPSRNTQFKYGGVFIGKRHTGKTTTIELMRRVFTSAAKTKASMIESLPADTLVTRGRRYNNGNEATPYIAMLEGKCAGVASETEKGGLLNNSLFKLLTGGDTLIARGLYQSPRSFTPTAQIIVVTNHSPRFDAQDSATVDRMVIVPFSVEHNKEDNNAKLPDEILNSLRPEYPGIIRMLAEYYIKLRVEFNGAIPFSDECLNYKNNYVDEQRSDLDKFVNDNIEFGLGGEHFEKVEDLYQRFLKYYDLSEESAEKESLPRKKFTYLLRHNYLEMKNYKKKRFPDNKILPCFFNIRLKEWVEDAERPPLQGNFDKESVDASLKKKQEAQKQEPETEENPFG
jgi:phage/plasmid-associated DNA primase